jgi:hypothetical protein
MLSRQRTSAYVSIRQHSSAYVHCVPAGALFAALRCECKRADTHARTRTKAHVPTPAAEQANYTGCNRAAATEHATAATNTDTCCRAGQLHLLQQSCYRAAATEHAPAATNTDTCCRAGQLHQGASPAHTGLGAGEQRHEPL